MSAELFRTPGNETANPQDNLAGEQPGASAIATKAPGVLDSGILDIAQICQFQVEQLAAQLPNSMIWFVYHNLNRGQRQTITSSTSELLHDDANIQFYLESEAWLKSALPMLTLTQLEISADIPTSDCIQQSDRPSIYIYPVTQHNTTVEYLLVWATEPLSTRQQATIEKTGQALHKLLAIAKGYFRQQTEIQLLEHVLHRAAHQLRTPLALIGLYAENLRLELIDTPSQEHAILIRDVVDELTTNLSDLLYCGQQAKLRVAPYDLRTIVMDSIQGLKPWIDQKRLGVHYPTTSVTLTVDRWQLKQVCDNLLNNAIHFSPIHGTITWRWHVFQDEVLVELADEGPGLSPDGLKQAFKPFYTRREGGTGLGLAIAQKIILDHQGNLWVDNLPGGGAQFSFTLPLKGFKL
jgi:signal transduction histidine kinase